MSRNRLQELYAEHSARLVAVARLWLHNRADSEDVVHDVFLKLHEKRIEVPHTPRAFLTACVRNAALDVLRAWKRNPLLGAGMDDEFFTCEEWDRELKSAVTEALSALSIEQREVIVLHAFQGLRLREVAEAMACSPATAASRLRYARAKLRPILRSFATRSRSHSAPAPSLALATIPPGETV